MNLSQAYGPDGRPREGVALQTSTLPGIIDGFSHWRTRPDLESPPETPALTNATAGGVPGKIVATIRNSGVMLTLKELREALPEVPTPTLKQSLSRLLFRALVFSDGKRRFKRYGVVKK